MLFCAFLKKSCLILIVSFNKCMKLFEFSTEAHKISPIWYTASCMFYKKCFIPNNVLYLLPIGNATFHSDQLIFEADLGHQNKIRLLVKSSEIFTFIRCLKKKRGGGTSLSACITVVEMRGDSSDFLDIQGQRKISYHAECLGVCFIESD